MLSAIKEARTKTVCDNLIVIGSSTGGPQTLRAIFASLACLDTAIIVVQHMPKVINNSLVTQLDTSTPMHVKLAEHREPLMHGTVFFAPSEYHLVVADDKTLRLEESDKVNFVRPSIDVTMKSLAAKGFKELIGIILTGLGSDGAEGLLHMKNIGAKTITQDETSCVIYGMPKSAYTIGAAQRVLTPDAIAKTLGKEITHLPAENKTCPVDKRGRLAA